MTSNKQDIIPLRRLSVDLMKEKEIDHRGKPEPDFDLLYCLAVLIITVVSIPYIFYKKFS